MDSITNVPFLIDSGCEVSIVPKKLTNGISRYFKPCSRTIHGIGNAEIHPIGSVDVELKLGSLEPIKHKFWVTEEPMNYGIIGIDILKSSNLAVSSFNSELQHLTSNCAAKLFTAADLATSDIPSINKGEIEENKNEIPTLNTNNNMTTKHSRVFQMFLPDKKLKNHNSINLNKNTNTSCDKAATVTKRQQKILFNCIMMVPIDCKGRIIGKKGIKIKEISQTCKVHIHIDTEITYYPRREFRVYIAGNPLHCKKAMANILALILQVKKYRQYPLTIHI